MCYAGKKLNLRTVQTNLKAPTKGMKFNSLVTKKKQTRVDKP
jgi:hypothetical protein